MRLIARRALYLALVLNVILATAACAAVPPSDRLRQWNPSDSWQGGKQYDPRLEKTVTFWNAGIRLAEVFRKVKEQTGVSIGFRPEGDVNARICVNLYLNRDQAPSLREFMAQLSWALDCAFSYQEEEGEIRYSLLSTSMGEGDVIGLLERRAREDQEAEAKATALPREEILRVQGELRQALSLSRDEVIRRYRDHDECVLWDVLDPARRALTELYLSWPVTIAEGTTAPAVCQRYSSLSPEQQRAVLEAVRYGIEDWLKMHSESGQVLKIEGDPIEWLASVDPLVGLSVNSSSGHASVSGVVQVMQANGSWGTGVHLPRLLVGGALDSFTYVELRRLLGDVRTPEDEKRIEEEYHHRAYAEEKEPLGFGGERVRREQMPAEMEQLLNSLQVVPNLKGMYALWQVQEGVAKVSGLNIVSDCFWQPYTRDLRLLYQAPGADREAPPTALMVLKAATARLYPWRPSTSSNMTNPFSTGWEWRSAGRFLTFRSLDRDLWRAAFLPAGVVQTMDAWVESSLTPPGVKKALMVTPDWRAFARLIMDLSVPQLRWGGLLAYGDQTDYREACRQSFRQRMLDQSGVQGDVRGLRVIGALSDAQWRQARTEDLQIGGELGLATAQQWFRSRPYEPRWLSGTQDGGITNGLTSDLTAGDVLRVRGGRTDETEWEGPQPTLELQVIRGEQMIGRFMWRTALTLHPGPTDSIILPPAKPSPAVAPDG